MDLGAAGTHSNTEPLRTPKAGVGQVRGEQQYSERNQHAVLHAATRTHIHAHSQGVGYFVQNATSSWDRKTMICFKKDKNKKVPQGVASQAVGKDLQSQGLGG